MKILYSIFTFKMQNPNSILNSDIHNPQSQTNTHFSYDIVIIQKLIIITYNRINHNYNIIITTDRNIRSGSVELQQIETSDRYVLKGIEFCLKSDVQYFVTTFFRITSKLRHRDFIILIHFSIPGLFHMRFVLISRRLPIEIILMSY